jgi:hypothetical protein
MALNPNALCTVAEAQTYMGHAAAPTGPLEQLINGYSEAIARYSGREWCPRTTAAARKFSYNGSGVLSLAPYELRTVSLVQRDTDDPSPTTIPATDYRLQPRNRSEQGTYLWVALPCLVPSYQQFETEVTITGDWGIATDHTGIPPDVKLAALVAVASGYRNPEWFAGRDLGALGLTVEAAAPGESLPDGTRRLLTPYRRPVVV